MPLEIRSAEPDRLLDFAGVVTGIDLAKPVSAPKRSPQSPPAWTASPYWCSTISASTTPSSLRSAAISARWNRPMPIFGAPRIVVSISKLPTSPISAATTRFWRERIVAACSASATCCGTRTARSSRPPPNIGYCTPVSSRAKRGTPSSICAPPMMRLTMRPRSWFATHLQHSQIIARHAGFSETMQRAHQPVPQRWRGATPAAIGFRCFVGACRRDHRLAGAGGARVLRDLTEHATQQRSVYSMSGGSRPGDLGQSLHGTAPGATTQEVRELHRTTVADIALPCSAA